ncbi:hypothetical protein [Candidatus Nitrospira bockiana]
MAIVSASIGILIVMALPAIVVAEEQEFDVSPPPALSSSQQITDGRAALPSLTWESSRTLFSDPPTLLTDKEGHSAIVPYVGLGLSGGMTTGDVNHQLLRNDLTGRAAPSLSFSDLSKGLMPNEVQIGIRLPF